MNSAQTSGSPTEVESPTTRVVSDVPVQTRSERFQSVAKEDFATVVGREPEWKLSPVQTLRPLIDGDLDGSQYPISFSEQPGLSVSWRTVSEQERGVAGLPEDRAAANAWESTTEVLVIELFPELSGPVTIDRQDLGVTPRAAHTLVRVHPNTHAKLFLRSRGEAVLAENVEFELLQDSSLHVVTVGEWAPGSIQYAHHHASMNKSAHLTHIVVSLGGDVVVLNPTAQLVGEGSEAHLFGVYFADATQHLEHRVYVHHQGPNTISRVTYKGALHGAGARTVWIGDVLIGPNAVGTDSYEQNRNLVLSEGTRADSIPNLEIKTGDIAGAGHASATGRFDDEQLFYLQSRGIKELDARRLVVMGFLVDVVSKIGDEEIRTELISTIQGKLTQTEVLS
jgi:Fe-S cluster assembly protein SufD